MTKLSHQELLLLQKEVQETYIQFQKSERSLKIEFEAQERKRKIEKFLNDEEAKKY